MAPLKITHASPVTVSLDDLQHNNIPFSTLLAAFGPDSLGILVVTGLPDSFARLRSKVLSDASRLATLPAAKLQQLTNPAAKYLVGWSHGVETLRPGVVDTAKGSYYVNCAFYQDRHTAKPGKGSNNNDDDTTTITTTTATTTTTSSSNSNSDSNISSPEGFEEYTSPNIWPGESDIPGFQTDAESLITLIIDTAVLVARACDRFAAAQQIPGYQDGYLERVVRGSTTTKARLLHYFPMDSDSDSQSQSQSQSESDSTFTSSSNSSSSSESGAGTETETEIADTWCTTHLDHGCLTGLTSAMFIDEAETEPSQASPPELPASPDPSSGLYILSRTGQICKVSIPRDSLAFQTGEALELITRGKFKAVPHFVKGVDPKHVAATTTTTTKPKIARNTLAVFTQPNLHELVDAETGLTFGEFARGVVKKNTAG